MSEDAADGTEPLSGKALEWAEEALTWKSRAQRAEENLAFAHGTIQRLRDELAAARESRDAAAAGYDVQAARALKAEEALREIDALATRHEKGAIANAQKIARSALSPLQVCPHCDGTVEPESCPLCHGKGTVPSPLQGEG